MKVIDKIITEPVGGAHRDAEAAMASIREALIESLAAFDGLTPDAIRKQRQDRFLDIGRTL
jgi:acetyl-CoA carboxylase carboxyl transferase subunit alpha